MAIYRLGSAVPDIDPEAFVHPAAHVIGSVSLAAGVSVWPGAVLRGDFGRIEVGVETSVQDNAVLHAGMNHPTLIGPHCVVGHLVHIEGAEIGEGVLLGVSSVVLPGAVVESEAVVAAGAVVLGNMRVPRGQRAQGVPARIVDHDRHPSVTVEGSGMYRELAERYLREMEQIG